MNRQGLTLIVVTHNPRVGERARRRIHLADGEVVSDERTEGAVVVPSRAEPAPRQAL